MPLIAASQEEYVPRTRIRSLSLGGVLAAAACATTLTAAPATAVTDDYVALGDSYTSGNGTFRADLDMACYRSTLAYPYLVAQQRPGTSLTFAACQGATTDDIVNSQRLRLNTGTDLVSITIGGNDIGFGDLVLACAGAYSPTCKSEVDEANARIQNELPAKLDRAYSAIKAGAPNARQVAVLGYGRFVGSDVSCSAASGITTEEGGWLNGVADNLDAVTKGRATAAGFAYQSAIGPFTGHDVCASDPYLNGRSWSPADAYHPTRSGHANGLARMLRAVIG